MKVAVYNQNGKKLEETVSLPNDPSKIFFENIQTGKDF
jgi:hypothetical protein